MSPAAQQEYPHGIMQMIGFKEFKDFLQLSAKDKTTPRGQELFDKGVRELKKVTRRYARQQVKWISSRFCSRPGPNVPPVYSVDTTDLSLWPETLQKALDVVSAVVKGERPKQEPEPAEDRDRIRYDRRTCQACQQLFLYHHEWQNHIKTKRHKHNVKVLSKARSELSTLLTHQGEQLAAEAKQDQVSDDAGTVDGVEELYADATAVDVPEDDDDIVKDNLDYSG